MKAIRIHEFGGPEVLNIEDVPEPHPGKGQVRVRVTAVSLNVADVFAYSSQQVADMFGLPLPLGMGNDFAGVIDEVGENVTGYAVGDRVFGGARERAAAEYIVVDPQQLGAPRTPVADELYHSPDGADDAVLSTIQTSGLTADAAIDALHLTSDDTVLIGGAAGGVGTVAVQLAKLTGARVIGTASPSTFSFLEQFGAEPVAYGDGLADRVRQLAPNGITAAADVYGTEAAQTALDLGVDAKRITAVATRDPKLVEQGIILTGSLTAPADSSDRLARLMAEGKLTVPVTTFPLDQVREATESLIKRHTHGKIVITL
ncbi:NADP-dependent oxidoreductase [Bifidobacterium sp. ESL0682]|uniref:NADP-dependent oxidoreductase n=1 Tax=Bifidobacterium sp. ESL0682 TaxID=2983212 RepID=UPI0023F84E9F|nr:NADP-dependent oxidoreductase [Bifidobacterium sp. ESL0682]WEV42471.1 NADP-dependent oxidoreductase [Bifidobacterium sp. ESL0682]